MYKYIDTINKTKAVKIVDDRSTQKFLRFVEDLEN